MSIQTVNAEILAGNFTNEQLNSVIDAVKFARSRIGQKNAFTLRAGAKVTATHDQLGGTVTGVVIKVKQKKALVKIEAGRKAGVTFDLPLSMLSAA